MSNIGTGIAAGVAAVPQTAQQTARAKDKVRNTSHRVADDNRDEFVERLASAAAAGDPDAELPDHQAPGYEQLYLQDGDGQPLAEPTDPNASPDPGLSSTGDPIAILTTITAPDGTVAEFLLPPDPGPAHPLYQHLDIQA